MTIPLQSSIVYGPQDSRRFGRSLGINLLPNDQKLCNFDCLYCQYERSSGDHPAVFPTLHEIQSEAGDLFSRYKDDASKINWITIAGNGEPTLHPEFPEAVSRLIWLRDLFLPGVPIGILSNASTCHRPEIQRALSKLEGRFMKLDAGTKPAFVEVNHPTNAGQWEDILAGLTQLKNIVLQSLFFTGEVRNVGDDQIDDWISAVNYIQPISVQVYTIDRPTRDESLRPVSRKTLESIAARLYQKTGVQGIVF